MSFFVERKSTCGPTACSRRENGRESKLLNRMNRTSKSIASSYCQLLGEQDASIKAVGELFRNRINSIEYLDARVLILPYILCDP